MLCNHLRALDVFIETVKYAKNNKKCRYLGHSWTINSNERPNNYCGSERCPEMGINSENFNYYANDNINNINDKFSTSKTFYVSTKRSGNCLKYFSDFQTGVYSNHYSVKPYIREMSHYFIQLLHLIKEKFRGTNTLKLIENYDYFEEEMSTENLNESNESFEAHTSPEVNERLVEKIWKYAHSYGFKPFDKFLKKHS